MTAAILRVSRFLSAGALCLMLAVVAAQVLARMLYNASQQHINLMFNGSIELASYALLLLVFAALPQSCAHGLVRVELFTRNWSQRWQLVLDRVWLLMVALFALAIASQSWNQAQSAWRRGLTSQDLNLPLSVFYGYLVLTALFLAWSALYFAWHTRSSGQHE